MRHQGRLAHNSLHQVRFFAIGFGQGSRLFVIGDLMNDTVGMHMCANSTVALVLLSTCRCL
ncbi:MAG: hypothetical protein ACXVOI_04470 [Tumebacillaceae bacterium]